MAAAPERADDAFLARTRAGSIPEIDMHHIDIGRMPDLNEEDKAFVKLMLRMRAIAGATVIGVIALIGITAAPGTAGDASTSVPAASSLSGAPSDAGLMALEHGRLG